MENIKNTDLYKKYESNALWVIRNMKLVSSIKKKNKLVNLYWTELKFNEFFKNEDIRFFNPYKMDHQSFKDLKNDLLFMLHKAWGVINYGLHCRTLKELEEWDDTL